ncbi:MAG: peptidoglycan-binding domain-containing protein [Pseudomonadota bacterium]
MIQRSIAVLATALIAIGAGANAQSRVCVEEVAGVCLKFETTEPQAPAQPQPQPSAPVASPAERAEQALRLSRSERREIQRGLRAEGFYRSTIDGLFGRGSRGAIGAWQQANGAAATGFLTAEQARRLRLSGQAASPTQTAPSGNSGSSASATRPRIAPSADSADIGELIGGLGCTAEVHGEDARIVFRRDGGAAASAVDVSLFVTWTFQNRRFCVFNQGLELSCFPLEMAITPANREQIRDRIQANCR